MFGTLQRSTILRKSYDVDKRKRTIMNEIMDITSDLTDIKRAIR